LETATSVHPLETARLLAPLAARVHHHHRTTAAAVRSPLESASVSVKTAAKSDALFPSP